MAPVNPTTMVLGEVDRERLKQDQKWREQNHPDFAGQTGIATGHDALRGLYADYATLHKRVNDARAQHDDIAWDSILLEEVYEALELAGLPDRIDDFRAELIQVAAVAVAWVECIDRRQQR